jgi:hypothetical protein
MTAGTVTVMDEARLVLTRLDRIDELEREGAPADELLAELRALVRDAETWLRAEPEPHGAVEALAGCRRALGSGRREVVVLAR